MPRKKNSRVNRAFSRDALAAVCLLPERMFAEAYGMQTVEVDAAYALQDFYHFKDNGSRVLAVAHLDTVVRPKERKVGFHGSSAGPVVQSGALDDRLGAYIVLELLPALGIRHDVLLTTGEESGQSTAQHFEPGKDYDWMIEFDRGGTDVVMYQYDDRATREAVRASGAVVGEGIFSDIAYLEHLEVKGFNWGVGYRDYHSVRGHAYLNETLGMVRRYLRFHEQNAGTAMPHVPQDDDLWYLGGSRKSGGRRGADPWYYRGSALACDFCGRNAVDDATLYCTACRRCQECGDDELDCLCYVPQHLLKDLLRDRVARIAAPPEEQECEGCTSQAPCAYCAEYLDSLRHRALEAAQPDGG